MLKQVNLIDSLRSFAAISVCLYHFICYSDCFTFSEKTISIWSVGQYGVYVFFVISGFIIPWSMHQNHYQIHSFFKFLLKRLVRLEPPYLVSILLILFIYYLKTQFHFGNVDAEPVTLKRIFLHLGYFINFFSDYKWLNNVYWTLAIEFQYYIIMAMMYWLFTNKLIYRIIGYALCYIMAIVVPDPNNSHFPAYAPLFLFGIIVFLNRKSQISEIEFWLIFLLCTFYNYFFFDYYSAIIGSSVSLVIKYVSDYKVPILNGLGKISYSMYLIHPIIGSSTITLIGKYAHTTIQQTGVVIIGITVTIVSSYIMYLIIEKPSKSLSSKIKF